MIQCVSLKLAAIPVQRHVTEPSLQLERAFHSLFMYVMSSGDFPGINWNRKTEFRDRADTSCLLCNKFSSVFLELYKALVIPYPRSCVIVVDSLCSLVATPSQHFAVFTSKTVQVKFSRRSNWCNKWVRINPKYLKKFDFWLEFQDDVFLSEKRDFHREKRSRDIIRECVFMRGFL